MEEPSDAGAKWVERIVVAVAVLLLLGTSSGLTAQVVPRVPTLVL